MKQELYRILVITAILSVIAVGIIVTYETKDFPVQSLSGVQDTSGTIASEKVTTTPVLQPENSTIPSPSPTAAPQSGGAGISPGEAQSIARTLFPDLDPEQVNVTFIPGTAHNQASYEFDLSKNGERIAQGGMDSRTGALMWYAIPVTRFGRPENPALSLEAAQVIAKGEIQKRAGPVPVILTESRYDSLFGGETGSGLAGEYVFVYTRSVKSSPCDNDGFTLGIDSVYGTVIGYWKIWNGPPDQIC